MKRRGGGRHITGMFGIFPHDAHLTMAAHLHVHTVESSQGPSAWLQWGGVGWGVVAPVSTASSLSFGG